MKLHQLPYRFYCMLHLLCLKINDLNLPTYDIVNKVKLRELNPNSIYNISGNQIVNNIKLLKRNKYVKCMENLTEREMNCLAREVVLDDSYENIVRPVCNAIHKEIDVRDIEDEFIWFIKNIKHVVKRTLKLIRKSNV